jgi:uncharacterized protein (TIGR02444 family)
MVIPESPPVAAACPPDGATKAEAEARAFKRFALAVYDTADIPAACQLLQGRFDLDVNLVLFAAFVGAARGQLLTEANLEAAHRRVDTWHHEVVRPLRAVRQHLKTRSAPAPDSGTAELRRKVQKLEIEAELIELTQLGGLLPTLNAPRASGSTVERATAAIEILVGAQCGHMTHDEERDAVAAIAAAAAQQTKVNE